MVIKNCSYIPYRVGSMTHNRNIEITRPTSPTFTNKKYNKITLESRKKGTT